MNAATLMTKLAGIRKAVNDVLNENGSRNQSQGQVLLRSHYEPHLVGHYFEQTSTHLNKLRVLLPAVIRELPDDRGSDHNQNVNGTDRPKAKLLRSTTARTAHG